MYKKPHESKSYSARFTPKSCATRFTWVNLMAQDLGGKSCAVNFSFMYQKPHESKSYSTRFSPKYCP
jgi:hypothetical protein